MKEEAASLRRRDKYLERKEKLHEIAGALKVSLNKESQAVLQVRSHTRDHADIP